MLHVLVCAPDQPRGRFKQVPLADWPAVRARFPHSSPFQLVPAAGPAAYALAARDGWFWAVTVQAGMGGLAADGAAPFVSPCDAPLYTCDDLCLRDAVPDVVPAGTSGPELEAALNAHCAGAVSVFVGRELAEEEEGEVAVDQGFIWLARPKHLLRTSLKRQVSRAAHGAGLSGILPDVLRARVQEYVSVGTPLEARDVARAVAHLFTAVRDGSIDKFPGLQLLDGPCVLAETPGPHRTVHLYLLPHVELATSAVPSYLPDIPPPQFPEEFRTWVLSSVGGTLLGSNVVRVQEEGGQAATPPLPPSVARKVHTLAWPTSLGPVLPGFVTALETLLLTAVDTELVSLRVFLALDGEGGEPPAHRVAARCVDLARKGLPFRFVLRYKNATAAEPLFLGLTVTGPPAPGRKFKCTFHVKYWKGQNPHLEETYRGLLGLAATVIPSLGALTRRDTPPPPTPNLGIAVTGKGAYTVLDRETSHAARVSATADQLSALVALLFDLKRAEVGAVPNDGVWEASSLHPVAGLPAHVGSRQLPALLRRPWHPSGSYGWALLQHALGLKEAPPKDPFTVLPAHLRSLPPAAAEAAAAYVAAEQKAARGGGRRRRSRSRRSRSRRSRSRRSKSRRSRSPR